MKTIKDRWLIVAGAAAGTIALVSLAILSSCSADDAADTSGNEASGGGASVGSERDEFLGRWRYESSTSSSECRGAEPPTRDLTGSEITVARGETSDTVVFTLSLCSALLTVDGSVARLGAPSPCSSSGDLVQTLNDVQLKLVAPGRLELTGTLSIVGPAPTPGMTYDCVGTHTGELARVGSLDTER